MRTKYVVYYEDGSSGVIEFKVPCLAHSNSSIAMMEALRIAEQTGKTVARLGSFSKQSNPLVLDDNMTARVDLIRFFVESKGPVPEEYHHLINNTESVGCVGEGPGVMVHRPF